MILIQLQQIISIIMNNFIFGLHPPVMYKHKSATRQVIRTGKRTVQMTIRRQFVITVYWTEFYNCVFVCLCVLVIGKIINFNL